MAPAVSKFADQQSRRSYATPQDSSQLKEYAFEMAASSIRFGPGATQEVGMDLKNMDAKRVCVVTDENVDKLDAMKQVREALTREGIDFKVFNKTRIEPKDSSSVVPASSWRPSLTAEQDQGSHRMGQALQP